MASVYTVGQVNRYIKNMFAQDFALSDICVKGEVSNCKYHSTGHIYFSLKDGSSVISAIMFSGDRRGLNFTLEEGQKVVVRGNISVFERDGRYQIYAKSITHEGEGLLFQRFEQLKRELAEMGLFDSMYKKEIPKYALKVGVCTAETGAAIQDIINISTERNPFVQLYLYPSLVQGQGAAKDIVNGIRCLDRMGLDVIIVGRGGGSIEDLWAFNEEIVAKAIFDCNTPIISAVGHQTDTTIADYVADIRVPTPSAAAKLAVFDYKEFLSKELYYRQMLIKEITRKQKKTKSDLNNYTNKLRIYSPVNQIQTKKMYLADYESKLQDIMNSKLNDRKHRLEIYAEKLSGLSPLNKISKGYAFVTDNNRKTVKTIKQVKKDDEISLIVKDGKIDAKVINVTDGGYDGK